MKREIKFRAWHRELKRMFQVSSFDEEVIKFINEGYKYKLEWKRLEFEPLMQYTGLPDKNVKEIYEEDILRIESRVYESHFDYVKVAWNKWCYMLINADGSFYANMDRIITHKVEIIGNIYQNPELLTPA